MDNREFQQLLKALKVPSGKQTTTLQVGDERTVTWTKKGGFTEKLVAIGQAALVAGLSPGQRGEHSHPDGSSSSSGCAFFRDDGNVSLVLIRRIGATARDNRFEATVTATVPPV